MASRFPLVVDSSAGQIKEIPAVDIVSVTTSCGIVSTLTDAATITPDFSQGNNFTVTLGGNRTLANPINVTQGQSGFIAVVQDSTGSRTLSFGSNFDWASGGAPTLTTTANAVDLIGYYARTTTSIVADIILNVS